MKQDKEKRIFLICSSNKEKQQELTYYISQNIEDATIYQSNDGMDALFKMDNDSPHVLICDIDLPKISGIDVVKKALKMNNLEKLAVILMGKLPKKEDLVNEVVTGQIQFIENTEDKEKFQTTLKKALNYVAFGESKGYKIVFLDKEETLFKEGEIGDCVYLIKSGELKAIRGEDKVIGTAKAGEFIGEMSHFNHEPRSATIRALSHCELIQIPFGTLDAVLFSKPAWAKALIHTLAKRLKSSIAT